jgi:hypothetical protein
VKHLCTGAVAIEMSTRLFVLLSSFQAAQYFDSESKEYKEFTTLTKQRFGIELNKNSCGQLGSFLQRTHHKLRKDVAVLQKEVNKFYEKYGEGS